MKIEIKKTDGSFLAERESESLKAFLQSLRGKGRDLHEANLAGADLSLAFLDGLDLSGADLRGAKLAVADLSGAYLSETKLSLMSRLYANLNGAYFNNRRLWESIKSQYR